MLGVSKVSPSLIVPILLGIRSVLGSLSKESLHQEPVHHVQISTMVLGELQIYMEGNEPSSSSRSLDICVDSLDLTSETLNRGGHLEL